MVLQHEYQHNETMLQTLQLKLGDAYRAPRATAFTAPVVKRGTDDMVRFPGGRVLLGTTDRSAAYDNERPQHTVDVGAFEIDRHAVTCAEYLEFVSAGGYGERAHWSDAGWKWRSESKATAPKYWDQTQRGWLVRRFDRWDTAERDVPVCHVSYHEAEAYARFRGKRLPTETEWETACTWDPSREVKSMYPWGNDVPTVMHANVDQLAFEPAPTDTFDLNVSPLGCYGMIGDVWEWTSTDFTAYPNYETFPYPEYSEVFFGNDYKVLRGGSWATRPGAIRGTFRNWDYPIRRQIFSGFRCAR
jgi:iron(II)-dependent oxidoreductase